MGPTVMKTVNLFSPCPNASEHEVTAILLDRPHVRLERIVSFGQSTPEGTWCDQDEDEWVVLLSGSAGLDIEGEPKTRVLRPGDYVLLPARTRHRVAWTDRLHQTVWLACHLK